MGSSASCAKRTYSAVPLHASPSQSVSDSAAFTCGSMLYGGVTAAAGLGSCSVWNESVRTIADALRAAQPWTHRVIACGGGVHNAVLMAALADALPGVAVESSAAHGLDPDFVEAMAFAWLARETLAGRPGNLPAVTGAAGPRVLGAIYPA